MRRIFPIASALVLLVCCSPEIPDSGENAPKEDPALSVSGLKLDRVVSDDTFYLTLDTKSRGAIDFKSSDPSCATVTPSGNRKYKIHTAFVSQDTLVTISFVQDAWRQFDKAEAAVSFTVLTDSQVCEPTCPDEVHEDLEGIKQTFTETTALVRNPERGLYGGGNINLATGPIRPAEAIAERLAGYTLTYTGVYLTDFMDGDISQEFLDEVFQPSMDALREAGIKCILRFAYKVVMTDKEDMEPEVDIVFRHVEQLKPYLQKNEDVIFVLQAGFVGPWGEWHSSTHFGDSFELRRDLFDRLLDALPASRQIQVRTPQFKMRMYDLTVADTLTAETAHDGSVKSRIAGHNDCFGANVNDYGTFDNEAEDREFWKADTRYMIMCGETCNLSNYCTCDKTRNDLSDYHWTALNRGYHTSVVNRWKTSGCFNYFTVRLGYRFVLQDLFLPESVEAGKPCQFTFRFYNTGYAAPMNPRDAILVWETPSGELEETPLGSDPRTWHTGYHSIQASFTPSTSQGTLYLKLSDPLLRDRAEYSIAFANTDVFDPDRGFNKLFEVK